MTDRDRYTFTELATLIESLPHRYGQKIVAIDGLGGAGKKVFAQALHAAMKDSAIIHASDFHKIQIECVTGTGSTFDPHIDWDRFDREIFTPLRFSQSIVYHKYDSFTDSIGDKVSLDGAGTIIVEGEFVTQNRFAQSYDFKIWIEIRDSVRMTRILESQGEKKWREWQERIRPIEEQYLDGEKQNLRADLVVSGDKAHFTDGYYGIVNM